jgi:hypothetical protein
MKRILKRPMFRMGGSSGTGITSGLDNTQEFRPGFKSGTTKYGMGGGDMSNITGIFPPRATFASDMIEARKQPITQTSAFDTATEAQRRIDLVNQLAPRTTTPFSPGSLSGFLTSAGLNLLSATPRGNIFATAAGAAQDPFKQFQEAKGKQSAEDRALALAATQAAITRGDTLADIERKEQFQVGMAKQAVKDERALQEFIYDKKLEIEKVKGEYDVKAEAAGGSDKLNIEVTQDLITGASRSIFDARNTLNAGVKEVDGKEVPLSETETRELKQIISENELFLEKQLGLPAEYAAILQSPERYDAAKRSAVADENRRRKEEWLAANPKKQGEKPRDYEKRFKEGVKEIDLYSQEADTIAQDYIRDQYYNFASGGRVGYQMGGGADMSQEPATMEQESPVQESPVQELSYNELRARLPKDIDNEIVMLLANSKQALLDFANIRTQQDIASFNQQYDVNLTLPQGA